MLDAGANISAKDGEYGYTPLHWAAYKGQLSTCQLLIERGANVNAPDLKMETPIMPASEAYPDIVKLLVEHGADVNAQDGSKWTALEYAVKKNQGETVKFLLEKGANANTQDSDYGWTPLMYAWRITVILKSPNSLSIRGVDVNAHAKDGLTFLVMKC